MSAELDRPVRPCGSTTCDGEAAVRVFWPGKALDMCIPCAERAAAIAKAMGFVLVVAPLGLQLLKAGEA